MKFPIKIQKTAQRFLLNMLTVKPQLLFHPHKFVSTMHVYVGYLVSKLLDLIFTVFDATLKGDFSTMMLFLNVLQFLH